MAAGKLFGNSDYQGVNRITGLPQAIANGQPVTFEQFNAGIEGIKWKNCRVSTQANLNLASPGGSISGITMEAGNPVLVRANTIGTENGHYIWNGAAVPMTRANNSNTASELESSVFVVEEGIDAGTSWRVSSVNFTLGTDPIVISSFLPTAPTASETVAGIAEIATQAETNAGADDTRFVTPAKLANSPFVCREFTGLIGDGTSTQFDVAHNLGNTEILWAVREVATGQIVSVLGTILNANTLRINATPAPSSGSLRVTALARRL